MKKILFLSFYWLIFFLKLTAQDLYCSLPELTDAPIPEWSNGKVKAPFEFYWKAKDGKFFSVNDWSTNKKKINQYHLYYSFKDTPSLEKDFVALPVYFQTKNPVILTFVNEQVWQLNFVAFNKKWYKSTIQVYQTEKWMQQLLNPLNSNKRLTDIVLPGSHDAGMSVLTATGGQQKGTINACNTLTQQIPIEKQLKQGIRMFDLRVGTFNQMLYTKHAASDCMDDAIGGGYGEQLKWVSIAIKNFLQTNREEILLLSFSHFCERETPLQNLQDSLINWIGTDLIYQNTAESIGDIPLNQLAGKVILSFEIPNWNNPKFPRCDIADSSSAFINFRRAYASTNNLKKLFFTEQNFFLKIQDGVQKNDLVRLDWQITQSADEASAVCNDFQDEHLNPLVNGAILLANIIRKNKSIIDHAIIANQQLPVKMNEWILNGNITRKNKPNIIYVDAAGTWVTNYCMSLLKSDLYQHN